MNIREEFGLLKASIRLFTTINVALLYYLIAGRQQGGHFRQDGSVSVVVGNCPSQWIENCQIRRVCGLAARTPLALYSQAPSWIR